MTTESGPNYDPFQGGGSHRSMVIECEADDLGNMLRRAKVRGFEITVSYTHLRAHET